MRPGLIRKLVDAFSGGELSSVSDLLSTNNYLINSGFDFAQRSTGWSNPGNGTFVFDRWQFTSDYTNGTLAVSRPNIVSSGLFPGMTRYGIHLTQSPADSGTTFKVLAQKIESVLSGAGKTLTFSFWALTGVPTTIGFAFQQFFGSGGSSFVQGPTQTVSLNTSGLFTRYSLTFNIPTLVGKTVGTGGDDYLLFQMFLPINTTFDFIASQFMINEGIFPSPWVYAGRNIGGELALCQRYFEKSYDLDTPLFAITDNGAESINGSSASFSAYDWFISYRVSKRIEPFVGTWDPNTGNGGFGGAARAAAGGTPNAVVTFTFGGQGGVLASASGGANSRGDIQWAADAEL